MNRVTSVFVYYSARYAMDTRAERLWNYIIAEFRAMGEGR